MKKKYKRPVSTSGCVNFALICAALLVSQMLSLTSVQASPKDGVKSLGALAEVNIRLTGNIVALSCTVEPSDVDKTISMGSWTTNQLRFPSGHSDPVAFSIHLTGCADSGVALVFNGKKDAADNALLALNNDSTAKGVAVEIMDASHKRIAIGDSTPKVAVDSQGNAVLNFSARYLAVAAPSAGTADADSEFTLTYD